MGDAFKTQTELAVPGQDLNQAKSNDFWSMLTRAGSGMNVGDMYGRAMTEFGRSPADLYGEFAGAQPGMLAGARNVADAATSPFGVAARDQAALASTNARRAIEQRLSTSGLGNYGSGAAMRAITQGATEPLVNAETQIAQMYGNALQGAYAPMAQMGYQNLLNRGSQYGTLGQSLFGGLAQQAAPEWTAPMYNQSEGWGSQLLGAAAGLGGNLLGGWAGSAAGGDFITNLFKG